MGVNVIDVAGAHNAATKRLVQKLTIIFVNTFMNILLYAEILNGLIFDSTYKR